jgi:diguanylate cyclase (GGDEF)-like protein
MKNEDLEIKRFLNVVGNIDIGVVIKDAEGNVLYVNDKFLGMYKISLTKEDFKNLKPNDVVQLIKRYVKEDELFQKNINNCFAKKTVNKGYIVELKDGKTLKQTYLPIYFNNDFIGEGLLYEDITEKIYLQTKLLELSTFDNLTKIYNRKKIKEEIKKYMELSKRYDKKLAVAIFDIDNFKIINDTYGQELGDNILIKVADIVNKRKRAVDIFGRLGGGEFVIILPETDINGASTFAEYLKSKIYEIILDEREGRVTVSFGVTIYNDSESEDQLINRAYTALDKSKKDGKNKVSFYEINLAKK